MINKMRTIYRSAIALPAWQSSLVLFCLLISVFLAWGLLVWFTRSANGSAVEAEQTEGFDWC